jgi:hypothetical protein
MAYYSIQYGLLTYLYQGQEVQVECYSIEQARWYVLNSGTNQELIIT